MCKLTRKLVRPVNLINEAVRDAMSEYRRDDLILPIAKEGKRERERGGEEKRVIEVSGAFLYFVRNRGRKVVTTLALEGAQDTSPRKVTSRIPSIPMPFVVRKV